MTPTNVLVFKTSVASQHAVKELTPVLNRTAGSGNWNFALDDCDRILRIKSTEVPAELAIFILNESGFECIELED
jgi:hypothetical protein